MNSPVTKLNSAVRCMGFITCLLAAVVAPGLAQASIVYENSNEVFSSGDFNGDGVLDALVLDKLTGNVRVGYATTNGSLIWSQPMGSGVENATGCAVGRFVGLGRDFVAVTAPDFNRVNILDLFGTNSAPAPIVVTPRGVGPHALVTLDPASAPPTSPYSSLLVASEWNDPPSEHLELLNFIGGSPSPGAIGVEANPFTRPNALKLTPAGSALAVGLVRGTQDSCVIWDFSATPAIVAGLSNLPPGGDYVFGNFNNETLPRFIFYQPGGTNLEVVSLQANGAAFVFGLPTFLTLAQPVQQIYYLQVGSTGAVLLQYADGVQALSFPGGTTVFSSKFVSGLGAVGNVFTGVVPLANGQLVLLDSPVGSAASVHGQVLSFDGASFTQLSSTILPPLSTRATRANVWLFQSEPFVNRNPGFVASLNAPDWSDGVAGLPGAVTVVAETDEGSQVGLGMAASTNLGSAPVGTGFALPNQYAPEISLFTYSAPRPREPVLVAISPPPGPYGSPIQVSLSVLNGGGANYRAGAGDKWHAYTAPFVVSNDSTILFYGTNSAQARSQIQSASYTFGSGSVQPATAPIDTIPGDTNAPALTTNSVVLSGDGTIFYSRRSPVSQDTIWAIGIDGSGDTFITFGSRPRATRDGHWLAFLREGNPSSNQANLWLRDLLSGQETRLLVNTNAIVGFDWRTDNSTLVIDYGCSLWSLSVGANLSVLLSVDCNDKAPAVNPVDGRIAFANSSSNLAVGGTYVVSSDGSDRQRITSNLSVAGASRPEWSPDGQHLVLVDRSSGNLGNGTNLWVVDGNGSNLVEITGFRDGTNRFQNGALWSPDGTALVGAGTIFGTNGLWIVPLTPDLKSCECPPRLLPTTAGDPIDFAGSIIVAPASPLAAIAAPGLFIRRDPSAIVVYWNTNAVGYSLESGTSLPSGPSSSPAWGPVNGPFYLVGDYFEYREPYQALLNAKFFRLHFTGSVITSQTAPQ